jgi:MFS family permease
MSRNGWRGSFMLAGCGTATLALAWWLCVRDVPRTIEEQPTSEASVSLRGVGELLSDRNVLLLSIGYFTVSYFEYIFFYWIYYYFKEVRKVPQSQVTMYTTAIFLSWVVMTPTGGFVSDMLVRKIGSAGRGIVAVTGIVGSVLLFILGTRTTAAAWTGVLYALSFGLMSSSDGPFWSATVQVGRERAGAACGILNTGSNVGGFIAPLLTPAIASILGWTTALYFACGVAFLGAGIWVFVNPEK